MKKGNPAMKKDKKNTSKNNAKGFTLIEIIGVVVIIGIITLVGTVSVRGYIEDSRAKTYESYKKDLAGASENLFIDCMTNNEEDCVLPEYGNDVRLSYEELVSKGYSKRLRDPEGEGYCDKSYVVAKNTSQEGVELEYQVCLFCSKYKSEENGCKEVSSNDTTPPTCDYTRVVGASTTWSKDNKVISIGCKDTGIGCKRSEFSKSIGKDGEVIKEGTITIEDNAGNKKSCSVDAYVDRKAPTCKIEVEDIGSDGWYKSGVTAKITNIQDEGSGIAASGMGTSLMNRDYNGKTSYTVTGGIVTVFGYVKDKVGNEGYCSKEIKVDNTNPTANIYMGYEVYPKENSTISGQNFTISNLSKYGNISGLIVYFKNAPDWSYTNSVFNSSGTNIKIGGGVVAGNNRAIIKIEEGEYTSLRLFIYSKDVINSIEKVEVIKRENTTSVWTNKDVSVYVEAYDTITGVGGYSYNGGTTYINSNIKIYSSNTQGTIKVKDKAGNVSNSYTFTINKIDKVAPTCNLSATGTKGNNNWFTGNVSINFGNATDNTSGSGVSSYGIGSTTSAKTTTLSTDHVGKTYTGYIEDNAGNTNTCNITVKRDATKPICELSSSGTKGDNNWYTSDVTIKFDESNTDDATSEVASYGIGGYTASNTATLSTDHIGRVYTGYIKDNAGNTNTCSITVKRDATKPNCELNATGTKGDNNWYISDVKIDFDNIDTYDATSEIASYGIGSYTGSTTTTLSTDHVGRVYTGYIKDNAGNTNECTITVKRDATAPTFTFTNSSNGNWSNVNVNVPITADDGISGIAGYYYSEDSGTTYKESSANMEFIAERNVTVYLKVCDKAGNCSTKTTPIKIDKTKPYLIAGGVPSTFLNNATLDQKDNSGNVVTGGYIQDKKCEGSTCSATVCLSNVESKFTIQGVPEDTLSNYFKDDLSGYWQYGITHPMLDKNGNSTEGKGCLKTSGHNPCTYTWYYSPYDQAGNIKENAFKIIFTIGYRQTNDGSGCNK